MRIASAKERARPPARLPLCWFMGLALAAAACGQESPPEPTTPDELDYFPLRDGAEWRYQHSDWLEEVSARQIDLDGEVAFLVSDSPNPDDNLRSDTVLVERGGRWVRVSKEVYYVDPATGDESLDSSVDYGAGFTRFNAAWQTGGLGFAETPEYLRVETPAGGVAGAAEERRHTFEVTSMDAAVTTPAGTFDCITVRRTKDWQAQTADGSDAQTKLFWFAPGIGKVQEFNEETGSTELLIDFSLPEPMP